MAPRSKNDFFPAVCSSYETDFELDSGILRLKYQGFDIGFGIEIGGKLASVSNRYLYQIVCNSLFASANVK